MSTTGVLLVPPLPGNISVAGKLIEHLSRRFPECDHREFTLEYRMFSDTSSQLPGSDVSQRCFTHVFASSHDPERGYLRTTRPDHSDGGESITIAPESIEPFINLLLSKLQPLWYHRQHLNVEDGVCVSMKNDEWVLSIGDVKVVSKATGTSAIRGTVIELHHAVTSPGDDHGDEEDTQILFRDVLAQIFHGAGQSFHETKLLIEETLPRVSNIRTGRPADWTLARMYMKILHGQR